MDQGPRRHETRALVLFALLLFVLTELVVIVTLWNVPNEFLNLGIATKYILPFLVTLPLVVGGKGYVAVKRRMVSSDHEVLDMASRQFLTTIIVAYAAIIFMVSALQR